MRPPERSAEGALTSHHQQRSATHDKIRNSRRRRDPCVRARQPCNGAGSHLRTRLLRAVLSKRQLPEQGTRKSLYRQLPASGLSGSGLSGSHLARTATTAATTTAASGRAMSRPVSSAARSARRLPSPPLRSAATNMPAATVLSASPAPGSAARTAGGISASRAPRESRSEKAAGTAAFSMRER